MTTWMNLEGIMLSEMSEREILYNLTNMWNLKILNQTQRMDWCCPEVLG